MGVRVIVAAWSIFSHGNDAARVKVINGYGNIVFHITFHNPFNPVAYLHSSMFEIVYSRVITF